MFSHFLGNAMNHGGGGARLALPGHGSDAQVSANHEFFGGSSLTRRPR